MGQVVRALEAPYQLVDCLHPDGGRCILAPACGLTGALQDAQEAFFQVLDGKTLADLTPRAGALTALLTRLNSPDPGTTVPTGA